MSEVTVLSGSSLATYLREDLELEEFRLKCRLREVKFWLLVDKQPEGCWPWVGFTDTLGYGQFERNIKAHRQAYQYAIGDIPTGMVVCHRCDNPPCCNPDHLFAGTLKDNSQDMVAKGRAFLRKLTPQQVKHIRDLAPDLARGGQRALAREFGVHPQTINKIIKRHTHRKEVMP